MYEKIKTDIEQILKLSVSKERKELLQGLIDFIQKKVDRNEIINLNFICTHNSRRSHLSQVWAQAMAHHFNVPKVYCYSGGTEATAMFPMAASALEHSGFKIQKLSDEKNPVYAIKYTDDAPAVIGFSKVYDDAFNPSRGFGAILTCTSADKGCPIILGAGGRFPIPFDDPKAFDGTDIAQQKYIERSLQIGSEMAYVFSQIK